MRRYILFSVFALLLLTACGGVITDQAEEKDPKKLKHPNRVYLRLEPLRTMPAKT